MAATSWRDQRNGKALARLQRHLPKAFPAVVLQHALQRPLIPPTPRRAIESYWRHHPLRADRLARALARLGGAPEGWQWRLDDGMRGDLPASFRLPPTPFRDPAYAKGPGHCCICGQPVFRYGWHRDIWNDQGLNQRATWHSCCVAAWNLWTAPSDYVRALKIVQQRRCRVTGARLLRTAEVDHRVPLFKVWREHRQLNWPDLLGFWGLPNLQVVNRSTHLEKSAFEAGERGRHTKDPESPTPRNATECNS